MQRRRMGLSSQSSLGYNPLSTLETYIKELREDSDETPGRVERHALGSQSGFTQAVEQAAWSRADLRLFALDVVVTTL